MSNVTDPRADDKPVKILYIGFSHPWDDPRLYYREISTLADTDNNIDVYYISVSDSVSLSGSGPSKEVLLEVISYSASEKSASFSADLPQSVKRFAEKIKRIRWAVSTTRRLKPDVMQASDVREILYAVIIGLLTDCRLVYDAHEDYFNQVYEYGGKTLRSYLRALGYSIIEFIFLRFFYCVFCADGYLFARYTRSAFGCREVHLLRNFVNLTLVRKYCVYEKKNHLRLVYIGGINQYRGIIECANHVTRFNQEHGPALSLSFTVYSPQHHIVSELLEKGLIEHRDYVDHSVMMELLPSYDIGVCLWQRIKKFERNLPIKNFEYMAVGMPVITSNFGNLRRYIVEADSGYCIDPGLYEEFEQAILELFDERVREKFGGNGISFTESRASFKRESLDYIKIMTMAD